MNTAVEVDWFGWFVLFAFVVAPLYVLVYKPYKRWKKRREAEELDMLIQKIKAASLAPRSVFVVNSKPIKLFRNDEGEQKALSPRAE